MVMNEFFLKIEILKQVFFFFFSSKIRIQIQGHGIIMYTNPNT